MCPPSKYCSKLAKDWSNDFIAADTRPQKGLKSTGSGILSSASGLICVFNALITKAGRWLRDDWRVTAGGFGGGMYCG